MLGAMPLLCVPQVATAVTEARAKGVRGLPDALLNCSTLLERRAAFSRRVLAMGAALQKERLASAPRLRVVSLRL